MNQALWQPCGLSSKATASAPIQGSIFFLLSIVDWRLFFPSPEEKDQSGSRLEEEGEHGPDSMAMERERGGTLSRTPGPRDDILG